MLNMRNQLDKIIITAMDRFVWFLLLVVISHLVTEFTRATGYTRGPRQDEVMVNDTLIQPIRVQNLVVHPGQKYLLHEQQNQQYYNDNNPYSNSVSSNKFAYIKNSNFLSYFFNLLTINYPNGQQQPQQSNSGSGNNNNIPNVRSIIESIFEIPISTLRAVNDLVGRLMGGFLTSQHQQLIPQQKPKYWYFSSYQTSASSQSSYPFYAKQKAADALQLK